MRGARRITRPTAERARLLALLREKHSGPIAVRFGPNLEEERVLSSDWVVRYNTRYFQVARQSGQVPARSTVVVRQASDGANELRYRGRLMRWIEIATPVKPTAPVVRPPLSTAPHRPARPSADHPWRRDTRTMDRERALSRAAQP